MRDMFKYIMIVVAGISLTSCNSIYENDICLPLDEPCEVSFVLAIDTPQATRAEWGEAEPTDEIGTTFENRILPESLRVSVYTADNNYLGDIADLIYWPINDDDTRYQFQGRLPQSVTENLESTSTYKFMVFANSAEGSNATLQYSFDELDMNNGAIPMWGVKQVDLSGLLSGRSQNIGVISLLRAAAKVEVILDSALTDCEIDNVTINYHNRVGYVLPTGWDVVEDTKAIDRDGGFRGFRSLHSTPHSLTEVEANKKFVIYLPEYDNQLFADYEAKLSVDVTYNGSALSFPDALQFKKYVDGRPIGSVNNIGRNTIYRFRITKVAAGALVLNYEVADWECSDEWEWVGSELILQLAEELFHRHRGTRNRHIAQIYHGFVLKIEEMQRTGFLAKVQLRGVFFPGSLTSLKADAGIPWLRPITQPFCRGDVDAVESCAINVIRVHIPAAFLSAV